MWWDKSMRVCQERWFFVYAVLVICSVCMLVSVLKDRCSGAELTVSLVWVDVEVFGSSPLHMGIGNAACHSSTSLTRWLHFRSGGQQGPHGLVAWCWAHGLVPLIFWVICSSCSLLATPQLIPKSMVGFWLYTLAQELLSHLRCWENEEGTWSRFPKVPEPDTTVARTLCDHSLAGGHKAVQDMSLFPMLTSRYILARIPHCCCRNL